MKKYLWILIPVFLLFVSGCSDEETQQISCAIQVPSDGETIQVRAGEKLFIRGYGKTDHGQIVSAELKVAGSVIPDVTTVPFYYGYSLPEDQAAGELKVELTVQGETGVTASTSSTVILAIDLGPQPPKVGTMTDSRDGIVYKTVQLGNQLWMAENLRYLPQQDYDVSSTDPKYYVMLDYDATTELGQGFLDAYGAYYNVPAALQGHALQSMESTQKIQGVCPEGWHIPSITEWRNLAQYVVDAKMAASINGVVDETAVGKALASTTMWELPFDTEDAPRATWIGEAMEENNATQFNGIPTGFRACAGEEAWMDLTYSAGWWSSTAGVAMSDFAMPVRMWATDGVLGTSSEFNPGVGLPVRCLRD